MQLIVVELILTYLFVWRCLRKELLSVNKKATQGRCVCVCVWIHLHPSSDSPCSFWFSLSILCSRICCRMAFLHSSLSSSLLLFVLSSGTTRMDESPLPPTPTWPAHTRPPSRQESPSSVKTYRIILHQITQQQVFSAAEEINIKDIKQVVNIYHHHKY